MVYEGDGFTEGSVCGGVVGAGLLVLLDLPVGSEEIGVGKGLRGLHGPESVALEVFECGVLGCGSLGEALDSVGDGMGECGSAVGLGGTVECLDGRRGDEGTGGVVNEDELGVLGEDFECGEDGLLAGGSAGGIGDVDGLLEFFGDV